MKMRPFSNSSSSSSWFCLGAAGFSSTFSSAFFSILVGLFFLIEK